MSHKFNLNDFRKKTERDFGPFVIEWGEEDELKSVEIAAIVTASPLQQVEFGRRFNEIRLVLELPQLTEAQRAEVAEMLIDYKEGDTRTDDELGVAILTKARDNAKDMLCELASDKRAFKAFAKEFNGELLEWFSVLAGYCAKYGLYGVNESEEANEGK